MLEAKVEETLVQGVNALGGLCIKLLTKYFSGLPDRLVLLPGGRIFFVELKRPKGGRAEPAQPKVHKMLAALGFPVQVLNTVEKVQDFLCQS